VETGTSEAPLRPSPEEPHPARAAGRAVAARAALAYLALVVPLVVLGELVDGREPPALDSSVTRWVGERRGGVLDPISSGLSQLSDPMTIVGTVAGAVVVLLVLRRSALAVALLVALPLELAVFLTVAAVVDRGRPAIEPLDPDPFTSSFPSGHTAAAVALYGALAWIVRRETRSPLAHRVATAVAVVAAVGVGSARTYRGMHHLTDVLAGGALGVTTLLVGIAAAEVAARRGVDAQPPSPPP